MRNNNTALDKYAKTTSARHQMRQPANTSTTDYAQNTMLQDTDCAVGNMQEQRMHDSTRAKSSQWQQITSMADAEESIIQAKSAIYNNRAAKQRSETVLKNAILPMRIRLFARKKNSQTRKTLAENAHLAQFKRERWYPGKAEHYGIYGIASW